MTDTFTTIRTPVRRRWVSVLLGIIIFIAGLAAGTAGTVVFAVATLQHILHHPEDGPSRITAMLTRKLSLDETQHQQVLAIITHHQVQIQAIRRQIRPQMDQQLDQIRAEIGGVLTDAQRERWQEMFDRLRERWMPTLPPAPATNP